MLIQKFHPGIRLAHEPLPLHSKHPLFSRQGHWDGGSTLHCAAMALALLGKLDDPRYLSYHDAGNERIAWDSAWPHYLHGLRLSELSSFIAELNLGVQPTWHTGPVRNILPFCVRELVAGRPVILGWRQPPPVSAHAALVVGIEGRQAGKAFVPHALLLLDPAENAPILAACNARLEFTQARHAVYRTAQSTRKVWLLGAVSIRPLKRKRAIGAGCV